MPTAKQRQKRNAETTERRRIRRLVSAATYTKLEAQSDETNTPMRRVLNGVLSRGLEKR